MKPPTCEAGVQRLMEYLEGELPSSLRIDLESHVAQCSLCRAFVASYVATPRIARSVTDHAPTAEQQRALRTFLKSRRES
jgi:anti-sigma factor RsiW